MNIHFNYITIHGFLSIGDAELDLESSGYTIISGVNNRKEDSAKSNGSGKSSIFEAICWALTGNTVRGTKTIVNNNLDGKAFVEVKFTCDGDFFIVKRLRKLNNSTELYIEKNGKDVSGKGIKDTEKMLHSLLPDFSTQLICSVIILGQGLPYRFSQNTPSGRKEVLETLSKSDFMILDLKDRVQKRKQFLDSELLLCKEEKGRLEGSLSVLKDNLDSFEKELKKLEEFDVSFFTSRIEELKEEATKKESAVHRLEVSIKDNENVVERMRGEYATLNNEMASELMSLNKQYEELKEPILKGIYSLEASIDSKKKQIEQIDSVVDVCPTCGQKILGVVKLDSSDIKLELSELQYLLKARKDSLEQFKDKKDYEHGIVEARYIKQKSHITQDANYIKSIIEEDKKFLNIASEELLKANLSCIDAEQKLRTREEDTKKKKEDIISIKEKIDDISKKILYNINKEKDISDRLLIVSKFINALSRDFRGHLLQNVIYYINKISKEYSKYIFGTQDISFILDGNNIDILYDNKYYESLSGGEKQKVDLIVQFAIRSMLQKYLNFNCNILVVDEIFDNLDSVGCDRVVGFITDVLSGVESIYVVTHRQDLNIPCDRQLVAVKDSYGVSKIVYGDV